MNARCTCDLFTAAPTSGFSWVCTGAGHGFTTLDAILTGSADTRFQWPSLTICTGYGSRRARLTVASGLTRPTLDLRAIYGPDIDLSFTASQMDRAEEGRVNPPNRHTVSDNRGIGEHHIYKLKKHDIGNYKYSQLGINERCDNKKAVFIYLYI